MWAVCICFISLQEGWKKGNRHSCNTVGGNDTFGLSHLFQSSSDRRKGVNVHFKYSGEVPGRVLQGKVEKHGLLVIFLSSFLAAPLENCGKSTYLDGAEDFI